MNEINDKKKLIIFLAVLIILIAISMMVYNQYKDRVDPVTGQVTSAAQASQNVSAASNFGGDSDQTAAAANQAPDITMQDADGKTVKLSDFKGKPVVLNFWTSWCSYCKGEMPSFESAYKQYGDKVQFIMLNPVKSERAGEDGKNFIKQAGYTFPVFYETEGKAIAQYGLRGFPATVFIDADGNIVNKNVGAIAESKLSDNIKTLLGQ